MEIVETWYFQLWVNFGGMAEIGHILCVRNIIRISEYFEQ